MAAPRTTNLICLTILGKMAVFMFVWEQGLCLSYDLGTYRSAVLEYSQVAVFIYVSPQVKGRLMDPKGCEDIGFPGDHTWLCSVQ